MGKGVKFTRIMGMRALTAGFQARRDGKQVTDCPYDTAGGRIQKALAYAWVQGYQRAGASATAE